MLKFLNLWWFIFSFSTSQNYEFCRVSIFFDKWMIIPLSISLFPRYFWYCGLLICRLVNKRYSFILLIMKFFIISFLLMIVLSFAQEVDSSYRRQRRNEWCREPHTYPYFLPPFGLVSLAGKECASLWCLVIIY